MADAKRARAETAPWLLPPIVLQIVHCLDTPNDVLAFLDAVPDDASDDALDALMTLLVEEKDRDFWPKANFEDLLNMDMSTVERALPALHTISVNDDEVLSEFYEEMTLATTTNVRADLFYPRQLRRIFDSWVANIVDLTIHVWDTHLDEGVLEQELAACPRLKALTIDWEVTIDQELLDNVMTVIIASCPGLADLCLNAPLVPDSQSCESFLPWLSRPSARTFKLDKVDFSATAAKALAHALLSSTSLQTIALQCADNLVDAFLDPSSPPLPHQLRSLTLEIQKAWSDEEALVQKLTPSALTHLTLHFNDCPDVTPIMAALPSTLRSIALVNASTECFPLLPTLQYLYLHHVRWTSDDVTGLTASLAATTSLLHLDLGWSDLDDEDLQAIIYVLPFCLSRQQNTCTVRLPVTRTRYPLVAAAMAQTRNTKHVHWVLRNEVDYDFDLVAGQCLVTALGATLQMSLCFEKKEWARRDAQELEEHAESQYVELTRFGLFLSPSTTPWMRLP